MICQCGCGEEFAQGKYRAKLYKNRAHWKKAGKAVMNKLLVTEKNVKPIRNPESRSEESKMDCS